MTAAIAGQLERVARDVDAGHLRATVDRWARAVRAGRADYARLIAREIEACRGFFAPDLGARLAELARLLCAATDEHEPAPDQDQLVLVGGAIGVAGTEGGVEVACLGCGFSRVVNSRPLAWWEAWCHKRRCR